MRLLPCLLLSSLFACSSARGDQKLLERVLSEYPGALKKLEESYARSRATGTMHEIYYDGKGSVSSESRHLVGFFKTDGCYKVDYHVIGEPPSKRRYRSVFCRNAKYGFQLEQASESGPILIKAVLTGSDSTDPSGTDLREFLLSQYAEAPFSFYSRHISEWIKDPSFHIKSASKETLDGRELVKIESALTVSGRAAAIPVFFWVSPAEGWILRKSEYRAALNPDPKYMRRGEIEYRTTADGKVSLSKVLLTHASFRKSFDVDDLVFEPVPSREFTLSYYGLPEIAERPGTHHGPQASFWFFFLAIILLAGTTDD